MARHRIAIASLVGAQSPPEVTLRSITRLVQITVVAEDKTGHPVLDLKKEDFQLFASLGLSVENGVHSGEIDVLLLERNETGKTFGRVKTPRAASDHLQFRFQPNKSPLP